MIRPPVWLELEVAGAQRERLGDPQAASDQSLGQRPVDVRARVEVARDLVAGAGTRVRCGPEAAADPKGRVGRRCRPSSTASLRQTDQRAERVVDGLGRQLAGLNRLGQLRRRNRELRR